MKTEGVNISRERLCERGAVVTVGSFDGVHRGHLEVLKTLRDFASAEGMIPLVITFDRHPLEVVAPERAPRLLITPDERDSLIRGEGVEVERISFTPEVARLTAGEWLQQLKDSYCAGAFISGYDNKFGCDGRSLSPEDYARLAREHGLKTMTAPEVAGVSSTLIRKAVQAGDMTAAAALAGRPYTLEGTVVEGRRLGRTIGFPTANLAVDPRLLLPSPGVYAADTDLGRAVVNIGDNPTVGTGNPLTVEAYLTGFSGDLYGKTLRLRFIDRLRGERKFDGLDSLRRQIERDVEEAERRH